MDRHVSGGGHQGTTEILGRSYQNVGSGCQGDEKWMRTICRPENLTTLTNVENVEWKTKLPFEGGGLPR